MTFCLEDALLQHGWREPWPHYTFRFFACGACSMSVGAEVVFCSLREMLLALVILFTTAFLHCYYLLSMFEATPGWRWTKRGYVTEVCKAVAPVLLTAYLVVTVPRRLCSPKLEQKTQPLFTDSSEDSSTGWESSDAEEAAMHVRKEESSSSELESQAL